MFDDEFELPDDLAAMADAAGAALAGMGEEFAAGAQIEAQTLKDHLDRAEKTNNEDDFIKEVGNAFGIAHNLKGQGATFGYNLVTEIAEHVCTGTRPQNNPSRESLPNMQASAQALCDILASRIDGDGGTIGARMRTDLGIS